MQEIAKFIPHLKAGTIRLLEKVKPPLPAALIPAGENFVEKGRSSRARHRLPRVGCGRTPYFRASDLVSWFPTNAEGKRHCT